MEEVNGVNGVNGVNVVFIPSNAFAISPKEVRLMIALGLALPHTTSRFAKMPIELVRKIADHFCEAQNSWLAENNCTSPEPTILDLNAPPQLVRGNVQMHGGAVNPHVQRTLGLFLFGQVPNP